MTTDKPGIRKRICILSALLAICAIIPGCELMEKYSYKPEFQISVNRIVKYHRASKIEKEIATVSGEKIWINVNPYLHSSSVKKVEALAVNEEETSYDLVLTLDNHGKLIWMQISHEFANDKMALVIDGVCYKTMTPERLTTSSDDEPIVRIKGPFEKAIAEKIAEHSEKNYGYYHRNE